MEPSIVHFNTQPNMAQGLKVVSALKKNPVNRNSPQYKKAAEASLTALEFAIKCTSAMKEKMLLPGHKSIKEMSSMNVTDGPVFVVNDLLGYYVMADRKKVYRDKIEEEVKNSLSITLTFYPSIKKNVEIKIILICFLTKSGVESCMVASFFSWVML